MSRFMFVLAYAFLATYQAYYLLARIGSTEADVPRQIFLGTLVQSTVGCSLSDRTGRRKVFVCAASIVYGLAMFVLAIVTNATAPADDDYGGSVALEQLGSLYLDLGRPTEAVEVLSGAVERARRARYRLGETEALIGLSRAWRLLGATDKALRYADEAIGHIDAFGLNVVRAQANTERTAAVAAVG